MIFTKSITAFQNIIQRVDWVRLLIFLLSLSIMFNALYVLILNITPLIITFQLSKNNQMVSLNLGVRAILEIASAYGLFVSGFALPSRSRVIWVVSIVGLGYLSINSLFDGQSLHNATISWGSLILLLVTYRFFNRNLYLSYGFAFISAFIIFALFYGTFGSFLLRSGFHGLSNLEDALYFSIITYSTVGYGDIYPLTSTAKLFVISMVGIGLVMFTSGVTLVAYGINTKLKNILFQFNQGKISMTNHIVVYGYGVLAKILISNYQRNAEKFVVITHEGDSGTDLDHLKDSECLFKSPYPGCVDILSRARVSEARLVIVNFDNDADTIFAILNLTEFLAKLDRKPKIVARIFYEENIQKAKTVGADQVIAPHLLAADAILKIDC